MWKQKRMHAREKSWSIFIVVTPALLAVTRDPRSDGSYSRNFQPSHQFRYISVDPFVPRDPVCLRKISAVKMTNFIMPWIQPFAEFFRFLSVLFILLLLLLREYIFRESFARYYSSQISKFQFPTVLQIFRKI